MQDLDFVYSILAELDIVILKRIGTSKYKVSGQAPQFYLDLYPMPDGSACSEPWLYSDMLSFFLQDAETFFARGLDGQCTSGIWQEEGLDNTNALVAHAIIKKDEHALIIRRMSDEYIDRVRILQKARTNMLETRYLSSGDKSVNRLANYDQVTGLYTKEALHLMLENEIKRANSFYTNLALIQLDIDDFKFVLNTFGPLCCDDIMKELAQLVMSKLNSGEVAAKYYDDCIIIILPNMTREQVYIYAEELRKSIESHRFAKPERICVSIGCTTYSAPEDMEELLQRVGAALYDAKRSHKNNVKLR